jgi:hypothetical protein
MTAVTLFDVLARDGSVTPDPDRTERIERFAKALVSGVLADWQRLLQYEQEFASLACATPALDDERNRSMYGTYQAWAQDAEQVLDRVQALAASGRSVANAEDLEEAYARVRARLGLTPEMVSHAMDQVRQGQARPLTELRDELLARIRA